MQWEKGGERGMMMWTEQERHSDGLSALCTASQHVVGNWGKRTRWEMWGGGGVKKERKTARETVQKIYSQSMIITQPEHHQGDDGI